MPTKAGPCRRNIFYGARNVSQAKLGSAIFIPEVARTDEAVKLTGPSPFRQMVNFVMRAAVENSPSYAELASAFDAFNASFREESSRHGFSVRALEDDINEEISHWGVKFGVNVNTVAPDDIVKSLLTHHIEDTTLGSRVSLSSYGQGLQRSLIYTPIRLAPKFVEAKAPTRKDFSPRFTLILFEEPDAFLHPSEQIRLNASLSTLSQDPDT